jgi:hypothetical protein
MDRESDLSSIDETLFEDFQAPATGQSDSSRHSPLSEDGSDVGATKNGRRKKTGKQRNGKRAVKRRKGSAQK